MTSKNSLCNKSLLVDNLRRHTWLFALYSVILFFSLPIAALLTAQSITQAGFAFDASRTYILNRVTNTFTNGGIIFLAAPAAVLAAASVFYYINSKKQVDFFHSLPIKRSRLFLNNIIVGFASFVIPYLVSVGVAALAYSVNGLGGYLGISIVKAIGIELLNFTVTFFTALFAFMLCGNLIVGLMGFAVVCLYVPAVTGIIFAYMEVFFNTFYLPSFSLDSLMANSSPVLYLCFHSIDYGYTAARIISYVILAAALAGISLLLYLNRRSESAGKAIAFKIAKPIIKYPLMFVATCTLGLLFRALGHGDSIGWTIFGLLCGAFLSHAIIEIIYDFDFKAMRKNIKPTLIFCAVIAVFYVCFEFDLIGYDRFLPDASSVKSVSLRIDGDYEYCSGRPYSYPGRELTMMTRSAMSDDSQITTVLAIARDGIAQIDSEGGNPDYTWRPVYVGFTLKSGRTVYRCYSLDSASRALYLKSLYDSPNFKQGYFDLLYLNSHPEEFKQTIDSALCLDLNSGERFDLTGSSLCGRLANAVCMDLEASTADYIDSELPVFKIRFELSDGNQLYAPVYGNFEHSLALLADSGIKSADASISIASSKSANIYCRNGGFSMSIESSAQLQALAADLQTALAVESDLFDTLHPGEYKYIVNLDGEKNSEVYYFKNDTPPAFVAQYFLENAEKASDEELNQIERKRGEAAMPGVTVECVDTYDDTTTVEYSHVD